MSELDDGGVVITAVAAATLTEDSNKCGGEEKASSDNNSSSSSSSNDNNSSKTINNNRKSATLESLTSFSQRNINQSDCSYANSNGKYKLRRGSVKLQPSPSSASSHSNISSLFRDDGFEDDLTSTGSEQMSNYQQHRLSFQGRRSSLNQYNHHHLRRFRHNGSGQNNHNFDDEEDYQSCEEGFPNSNTTASIASNFDDCALSTTSSSIINQHHQQVFDKLSLANAKQQYRKSLLLEHQQQQHLLHSKHVGQNSKIQSLIVTSPKIGHLGPISLLDQSANSTSSSSSTNLSSNNLNNNNSTPNNKQTKCDDRTVNIIGHMLTRSPGYWDSNLSITQRVVTEIIETERTYVDDLEQIVTGYICYLRNVLKKQKQHQQRSHNESSNNNSIRESIINQDCKSMLAFDDDTANVLNEVEDDDVDEPDNELVVIKENMLHHHDKSVKNQPDTDSTNNNKKIKQKCNNISTTSNDISPSATSHDDAIIVTSNHIKKLFSNLEDIYKFNKDLLFRLEECYLNPSSVAECFVENASGFEVYTHYCTMYPQVVSTLTELMANQASAQLLKERQNELEQSLPLGAYLLKPVQRILKYHILFQSLIKHTSEDETIEEKDRQIIDEAFSVMTSIACHINAMKKRHEHAIRVQEVQGLLSGWEGPDLTTLGELILEDTFKLYNRPKSTRHLFLFDNVLLFTKKKRDGSLCYKGHIACNNLMLIENIEGQPLVFNTVPFDNPKALNAFQAKNLDKKRDWCMQMKEVIIKSFEVKIPVHVRDILMSLTNNSDKNTTSSPKSPATETARALLKAPNYLEKKRLKQDKKK